MAKTITTKPGSGPNDTKGFPASTPPKPNTGQPSTTPPPKPTPKK